MGAEPSRLSDGCVRPLQPCGRAHKSADEHNHLLLESNFSDDAVRIPEHRTAGGTVGARFYLHRCLGHHLTVAVNQRLVVAIQFELVDAGREFGPVNRGCLTQPEAVGFCPQRAGSHRGNQRGKKYSGHELAHVSS